MMDANTSGLMHSAHMVATAADTCECHACRPLTPTGMRMVVCPVCGFKRCPKANDHRNACSGSNEPGQPGSAYPGQGALVRRAVPMSCNESAVNEVHEQPILMNAPNVRSIQADYKTQTRRICRHQEALEFIAGDSEEPDGLGVGLKWGQLQGDNGRFSKPQWLAYCAEHPEEGAVSLGAAYGKPGDRLHVKEAAWMWCERRPNGQTKTGREKWWYVPLREAPIHYVADHPSRPAVKVASPETGNQWGWRLKIGRFQPRWASRISLEVVDVRIQRLKDISESDAIAEGIRRYAGPLRWVRYLDAMSGEPIHNTAVDAYRALWESIHGAESWDANPFVWAVTFSRMNHA